MTDYSPEGVSEWMNEHGRVAYQAYRDSAGGRTPSDRLMPYWEDLSDDSRSHWIQAALAAVAHHVKQVETA